MRIRQTTLAIATATILLIAAIGTPPIEAEQPDQKKEEKVINIKDLIARETAMKMELAKVNQSLNQNLIQKTVESQDKERSSWMGKAVKGSAEVVSVMGSQVTVFFDDPSPGKGGKKVNKRIRYVFVNAKDKDDPLLQSLKGKDIIEFTGVIPKEGRPRDGAFTAVDCVIMLKK